MKILTATLSAAGGFYVLDRFLFNGQYTDLAIRMARVVCAAVVANAFSRVLAKVILVGRAGAIMAQPSRRSGRS